MKFFWPDPLDLIDPTFDFLKEKGKFGVAKQQNQKFPHEVFDEPLYHGFVISKINVEKGTKHRWNISQIHRFYREGAKRFLRFPPNSSLTVMGDSGAYTRTATEQLKKHLVDECLEVLEFYNAIDVDYGLSPDNVISGCCIEGKSIDRMKLPEDWCDRWVRTLQLAEAFWSLHKRKKPRWKPIGVAQGWDPSSYQESVKSLQEIGYDYIALGGLNRLNNEDIIKCVIACYEVKLSSTKFHLLGICRVGLMSLFHSYGVESFDSAMPIRQAINDDRHNYHFFDKSYLAIRIPQTYASPRLKQLISREKLDQKELWRIEQDSLEALRKYDQGQIKLKDVIDILDEGIVYRNEQNFINEYKVLLEDRPWKSCNCFICRELGIEVVILRNRERNLRRGFHNLYILSQKLQKQFPSIYNRTLNTYEQSDLPYTARTGISPRG